MVLFGHGMHRSLLGWLRGTVRIPSPAPDLCVMLALKDSSGHFYLLCVRDSQHPLYPHVSFNFFLKHLASGLPSPEVSKKFVRQVKLYRNLGIIDDILAGKNRT